MLWLRSHFYSGVSGASVRNPFYGGERSSQALDNIRIGNDVVIDDGDVFHVRRTRTGGSVRSRDGLSIVGLALLTMRASRVGGVVRQRRPRIGAPS